MTDLAVNGAHQIADALRIINRRKCLRLVGAIAPLKCTLGALSSPRRDSKAHDVTASPAGAMGHFYRAALFNTLKTIEKIGRRQSIVNFNSAKPHRGVHLGRPIR
jgi:hypothetical protein